MDKKFESFAYLPESYADYKDTTAHDVLQLLDQKQLTDFVYDMYEMYHSEAIENAFSDLDSLINTGRTAW